MQVKTLADLTGTSAALQVSSTSLRAKWVHFKGVTIASAAARVGDANVSATQGETLPAAGLVELPPVAELTEFYDLSQIYVYATTGDKVSVTYAIG